MLNDWLGAKHLYLLDFDETNLPDLKQAIENKYPDVKAGLLSPCLPARER